MKVAYDTGSAGGGNAGRGIGRNTNELLNKLNENVEAFDFKSNNRKLKTGDYDIAHYTVFNPHAWSVPFSKPTKKVVLTIHDLIRLVYPKAYPPGIKGTFRFLLQKWLVKRNVDHIITISETSKKDIIRFLGIPSEKISVVYLAPKTIFRKLKISNFKFQISKQFGLPNRFVLYVGDVNYNKNLMTLADACKAVKIPLVMVGKMTTSEPDNHPENRPFADLLKKYSDDKDIIRLGFVEDSDLFKIWNLATVYCQPSYYEGFGLILLESMACGVPVVASKIGAHLEVGGDACLYADPNSSVDFAEKIKKVLDSLETRNNLIKKGNLQVKRFSWAKAARETMEVYAKV
jgi:glycosyltransferase involved in cell wall biosynthesis